MRAQHRRAPSEANPESGTEPNPSEEADESGEPAADPAASLEISLNGEAVHVDRDTTVGELRETADIGTEEVFTHRSNDGIEALTDDDVVSDHVGDGDEIRTQPMADSEVFGAR